MSRWRSLSDDGAAAAAGLATDEALMLRHGREDSSGGFGATLRLYTYRPHCALVGRYQNLEDEVDLDFCRAHDVQVGRRPTGGGAIIMGPGQLGIAVAAPASAESTPRELLKRYAEGVIAGLRRLGVDAAFRSKNDLEVSGRKIAGLGLYLDPRGAILFHTSVLADLDVALMLRVLRIPGAKLAGKAVARISERVTTVSRELDRPVQATEVRQAVRAGFAETFGVELQDGELDEPEARRRDELVARRYGDDAWIYQRSPRRDARGSALLKTPEGLLRVYVATHGEVIKSALVTGDFNVLPPAVSRLEATLRWSRAEPGRIGELTAESSAANALGMPSEAIASAIWEATEKALDLQRDAHPQRLEGSCYFPDPAATSQPSGGRI
ncbi:MAG: lipoate--protein ligase family protein [bacterium]|nr:lipoate--protein ligase family protein [bacterium]